jgi:broad specificity phosphatase PhoE
MMPEKIPSPQIPFRYRNFDSPTGVTRETAKRLAERLGVDETQLIHLALHQLAVKILPQYEQDNGPLTATQVRQIKKLAPAIRKKSVRSSLLGSEIT